MPVNRTLLYVLLAQVTVALGLIVYMAVTDRALVVEIAEREGLRTPEPSGRLVVPVAGVRSAELSGTYGASRPGGRAHKGLDIHAPEGTAVVAAATGVTVALDSSALGGLGVYQRDLDQRTIYFYGHLQRYRSGVKEGDLVRQGDVVAYVGQTGNAGTPHLHFSVHTVTDPNTWWQGRDLSPCELLSCGVPEDDRGS